MRSFRPAQAFVLAMAVAAFPAIGDESREKAFIDSLLPRIDAVPAVRGDDGEWFFPTRELRHLATGRFWEQPWKNVAASGSDPVPGMREFHEALAARGIRLVIVPVPAKAAVYPDKLVADSRVGDVPAAAPFFQRLKGAGLEVIDLEPLFQARRESHPNDLLYCRQDAHFSPLAASLLADAVHAAVPLTNRHNPFVLADPRPLSLTGDLIAGSEWADVVPPEQVPVVEVKNASGAAINPDPASPILLLGDSHTLVFHEGAETGMHCRGAGVFEQLALRYGFAPDLVGVRGSGLVQARKQLFYHASQTPGYWDSKKLVVWLFSIREFTQSKDKPVPVPLTR